MSQDDENSLEERIDEGIQTEIQLRPLQKEDLSISISNISQIGNEAQFRRAPIKTSDLSILLNLYIGHYTKVDKEGKPRGSPKDTIPEVISRFEDTYGLRLIGTIKNECNECQGLYQYIPESNKLSYIRDIEMSILQSTSDRLGWKGLYRSAVSILVYNTMIPKRVIEPSKGDRTDIAKQIGRYLSQMMFELGQRSQNIFLKAKELGISVSMHPLFNDNEIEAVRDLYKLEKGNFPLILTALGYSHDK